MANATAVNQTYFTSSEYFNAIWKLSRVLLSAGWRYKASGNGQASGVKDTTGNLTNDTWSVGGAVNLTSASRGTGSGTGVSIAAASASTGLAVISGVSGFAAASVGDYLVITGSTSGGNTNNGNYRITAQTGTTVTVYAPGLVAETANAGLAVLEKFGGAGASVTLFSTTTSGQSPLITITGLSGLTNADIGRFITIINAANAANNGTWLIVSVPSSSSVLAYNPTAIIGDSNNGSIQWVEVDPFSQVYPGSTGAGTSYFVGANGIGAWIDLQGPTIVKVPIGTNAVTGSFIRGENVTQTTTGAQGELLGLVQDTSGGAGFLVIAPRVLGTGVQAGPITATNQTYGWNNSANTDTVTGAFSGATVTTPASSTPIAYISETVFWKGSATTGHIYHQRIDQNTATESATSSTTGRFSILSALGGCTSVVCPAGSTGAPTANGFPTVGTYTVIGTGGSGAGATGAATWIGAGGPTTPGKYHLLTANCVEQQGVSQDGNWAYYAANASTGYLGMGYHRMDNQEDGDLDPYVHQGNYGTALNGAANRTVQTTGAGSGTDNMNTAQSWITGSTNHGFHGFRRRGLSGETFNYFSFAYLVDPVNSTSVVQVNSGNPDQVATAPSTTYVREPPWLYLSAFTTQSTGRMRKGTPRWLHLSQGVSVNSTFDSLLWIVLSSTAAMFVAGPWDGATTPSF